MCDRRPVRKNSQKSPRRISPRGPDDFCDDVVLPPDLPDVSIYFRSVNKLQKMQRNKFDELKLP
jgi:hypothetical protein